MPNKAANTKEASAGARKFSFRCLAHELDESLPLIYMWEIWDYRGELVGRYVGKAKAGASAAAQTLQTQC